MDYQVIIDFIADICEICVGPAILIGLLERLINWFIRCATGKES